MTQPDITTTSVFAVDGDIVAYRSASVTTDKQELHDIIDNTLGNISRQTGVKRMRVYLSGEGNFREKIAITRPYKGNRKSEKPLLLRAAREYMILNHRAVLVQGYEADDAIASDMTQTGAFHCGVDKDILQVPGWHYNYVKEKWAKVTPEQALVIFYTQLLVGDSSDNIPGLKGCGAKKAAACVLSHKSAELDCKKAYMEELGDEWHEYFLEQKKLIQLVCDLPLIEFMTHEFKGRLF